jgi:hypothetical protein
VKGYKQTHKEVVKEQFQRRYAIHKDELLEKHKEYTENNKEKVAKYHKQYNIENAEKNSIRYKEYSSREEVKQHRQEYWEGYYLTNREEILDRAENIEEVPPMKAATHAVEEQMRDIAQMMGAIAQRTTVQFSPWEIIKFMRNSILTTINVDIFVIKNTLKNKYKIDLKKDDWIVIRTVMIINKLEWWLDDIKSLTEKENPDIFKLYKVDKQNNSYLPICMLFPTEDGKFMDVKQYIDSQPNGIRNKIMTIQNHFGSQIESTAKWTVNFQS